MNYLDYYIDQIPEKGFNTSFHFVVSESILKEVYPDTYKKRFKIAKKEDQVVGYYKGVRLKCLMD